MVHISDGVLSGEVLAAGWLVTVVALALTLRRLRAEEIPKLSLTTAAFFVASLVHVPFGPTSVHLIMNGLVGVILGPLAFISVFIGLVLQAFLFGHGGITVIGVNAMNMGLSALAAYALFRMSKMENKVQVGVLGFLAGGLAVALAVILTALVLFLAGEEFTAVAIALLIAHIPIIIIEAIIVGSIVAFLLRIKPEMLKLEVSG
ncbi:MAG: cobalt transporter CbiM [Candidatus Altiarchaeota archaeon]|nr:cobalt transporter CbiM [Candidatus Altiarchaeota archaeon]MBU4406216.1 cobalt transporter CbiM [Candidatus Altiarchaeota archaeon]MBU4437772.1 cobalt transporter CbiM [Candidatus Altiarchaeota archaeon]